MADEEWIGAKEATALLGISRARLYQLIDEGKLTAYQTPAVRRFRFKRSEIEALARPRPVERRGKVAA
jgi:excisionase family DNA binding protein